MGLVLQIVQNVRRFALRDGIICVSSCENREYFSAKRCLESGLICFTESLRDDEVLKND